MENVFNRTQIWAFAIVYCFILAAFVVIFEHFALFLVKKQQTIGQVDRPWRKKLVDIYWKKSNWSIGVQNVQKIQQKLDKELSYVNFKIRYRFLMNL